MSSTSNPLVGLSQEKLAQMGRAYAEKQGITDPVDIRAFEIGAQLASNDVPPKLIEDITDTEIAILQKEETHRWHLPGQVKKQITIVSLCAIIQGMDETVINGAQSFYKVQFGIATDSMRDSWLLGLTNAAPYLVCALVGCWLTAPLNSIFGRRGTLFFCCAISILGCILQAFASQTWWHMFATRCILGLSIGPKSATTPMYAAECSPSKIRGALATGWQLSTALGIMLGYVAGIALYRVPELIESVTGLNWRLMMVTPAIPAVIVMALIFTCAESPRWLMSKGRHAPAYKALCRLRFADIQAARDIFFMNVLTEDEANNNRKVVDVADSDTTGSKNTALTMTTDDAEKPTTDVATTVAKQSVIKQLFCVRRNRNAMIASQILMLMQQACGINVIAYYSSEIFLAAGFTETAALAASLGFGAVNFLFCLPGSITIDKYGRRFLLLLSFPIMAFFMMLTGMSFNIPAGKAQIGCIAAGIYLFGASYSPGAGPVPFTYSAEAYPLAIRAVGMSLATATTWFFNALLALTWPSLVAAFRPQGAFTFYAAWNIIGWLLVLFFVPETKERSLEELDAVFSVPLREMAKFGCEQFKWGFRKWVLFRRGEVAPVTPLAFGEFKEEQMVGEEAA